MSTIFIDWMKQGDRFGSIVRSRRRLRCLGACACVLAMGAVLAGAQQQPSSQQTGNGVAQTNGSAQTTEPGPSRPAAGATPLATPSPRNGGLNPEALNAGQRKQIAADSARILKLATELKAEVDKTTKETLSMSVIHKADEIEKLAHSVKEEMKLTAGTN